ncbi:Rieske (2Fe-2S) protein [Actinopolymorpha pittospori]
MKYVVATLEEIAPGDRKIVEVAGRSIGIFNVSGELFALRNRCPHQGAPLCQGSLWGTVTASVPGQIEYTPGGEILSCPHHGWEFHIRTGQSWCDPGRLHVGGYRVDVESGKDLLEDDAPDADGPGGAAPAGKVKGPYVAETIPVTIEGHYVVLDIA